MVLYFVCKLKLVSSKPTKKKLDKNKVSLVCFSDNDEEAWKMVKAEAHAYKTKKNDKLCDQTDKTEGSIVKEIYKIRVPKDSEDKIHTIEVIKQWRESGWVRTDYKEQKIAEFSMVRFSGEVSANDSPSESSNMINIETISNTLSTSNPKLLKDLRDSDLFRERVRQVEKYSRHTGIDNELSDSE